ncbi:MAG: hypothetical protein PWP54_573 [Thermosipho sp. (in: thermotogales)]|nr:hypothetical protein [Thermosipho sp. (in: thermotogales)]
MINISKYQGISQFGPAYKIMFENDVHAPGSVDRILMKSMIRLCSETADYLYSKYTPTKSFYQKGTCPKLEQYVQQVILGCNSDEERIEAIAQFTSSLQSKVSDNIDAMRFGGFEEEIIARGSDMCTDVARVGCALCQVAGFPARIIYLIDTEKPYSGHAIIEVYRAKVWGAVDTLTNVIYRNARGEPVSTWDLMKNPDLIERHSRGVLTPYTTTNQFRGAAISNYFVWDRKKYDYTESKINDYYRSIFEMSLQGWPGGLRWLHGEDK